MQTANTSAKKKLLLIDDEKNFPKTIAEVIGYFFPDIEVLSAHNGLVGCDKAEKTLPDLILMNYKMPMLDGIDATIRLKEQKSTKHIPVIMHSGYPPYSIPTFPYELFEDFISLPLDLTRLITTVNLWFGYTQKPRILMVGYEPLDLIGILTNNYFANYEKLLTKNNISMFCTQYLEFVIKFCKKYSPDAVFIRSNSGQYMQLANDIRNQLPALDIKIFITSAEKNNYVNHSLKTINFAFILEKDIAKKIDELPVTISKAIEY